MKVRKYRNVNSCFLDEVSCIWGLVWQCISQRFLSRELGMFSAAWKMLKDTVFAFINDEALSRGAAIAFYTVTSIAPVLLIVIAVAGLASAGRPLKTPSSAN
jgi:hypothetical protein